MAENTAIPIIDISVNGADELQVARELVDAAARYGFVYIRNMGKDITPEQIDNAFEISRALFASPVGEKQRCTIQKNNQGWSGMHSEKLDPKTQRVGDLKEAFNFGPFTEGHSQASQPIPSSIFSPETQSQIGHFRESCHRLSRRLLSLFGQGLAVTPPNFFAAAHASDRPNGSILRMLYYPSSTDPANSSSQPSDVRAGAHSDYGSVTLLFRLAGQAGLELHDRVTGSWSAVPVVPAGTEHDPAPPILVNIGDLLSYWTNGLLRSTVHRVVFSPGDDGNQGDPRYSIVFFCHPADDTRLDAVPSERVAAFKMGLADANKGNPYAERKVITAEEHLKMRLRETYEDLYSGGEGGEKER